MAEDRALKRRAEKWRSVVELSPCGLDALDRVQHALEQRAGPGSSVRRSDAIEAALVLAATIYDLVRC